MNDVRFVAADWVLHLAERPVSEKLAPKKGVPFAKVWAGMAPAVEALHADGRQGRHIRWVNGEPRADALAVRIRERLARGEPEAQFDEELEAATLAFGLVGPAFCGGTLEDFMQRPARALWHWADRAGAAAALSTFLRSRRFTSTFVERAGAQCDFALVVPGKDARVDLHHGRDLPALYELMRAFGVDELGPVLRECLDDEVLVAWLTDDRLAAWRLYQGCVAKSADLRTLVPLASILDDAQAASMLLPHVWNHGAILRIALTHGLGVAEAVFARAAEDTRCWAPVLACYPSIAAARLLVPMLEKKADRKLVGDALSSMPEEALVVLREELAKKSKYRDAIESLVATLASRAEKPLATTLAKPAEKLVAAASSSTPSSKVPRVLTSPPWRAKTRPKPVVVEGLAPREVAVVIDLSSLDPALIEHDVDIASRMADRTADKLLADRARGVTVRGDAVTALSLEDLERLRESAALAHFSFEYWLRDAYTPGLYGLLHTHGVAVAPALIAIAKEALPQLSMELAYVGSVAIAPLAVGWLGIKAARKSAESWAKRFPEHAAHGLLPIALSKPGTSRDRAIHLLLAVDRAGHRDTILVAARAHGDDAFDAASDLLGRDPLEVCPAKAPKLPEGLDSLPSPKLRDGSVLSDDARVAFVEMLAFSPLDPPYAGITEAVAACDRSSLDDFAEALVRTWVAGGMASAHEWMVRAVALIGTDASARFLDGRSRAWAQDGSKQRAMLALDVLGAMGSDVALSLVGRVSRTSSRQYLKDRAIAILVEIAEARGLSADELEDRTAPDLGLDPTGTLTLDFGPRTFSVGFDEQLRPLVRQQDGTRLDALPRSNKTDDAVKAKSAAETWKAVKTDAERVAGDQIMRLERMMANERRVDAALFASAFVEHPLVGHLVKRLVWGAYDASGALTTTFRVAEDRSFATVADAPFALPDDARVGVVHPCALAEDQLAAWGAHFAEYELLQPFAQIGRPTVTIDANAVASRYSGKKAPSALLYGLRRHGWRASADESGITRFARHVGATAYTLTVTPTLVSGESTLHELSLSTSTRVSQDVLSLVQLAELVHQLDSVIA